MDYGYENKKPKKVLKIWQFIVLILLMVAMLSTMFMPICRINGNNFKKYLQKLSQGISNNTAMATVTDIFGLDIDFDEIEEFDVEEVDKALIEYEKNFNVNIRNMSPFTVMTTSVSDYFLPEGEKIEDLDATAKLFLAEIEKSWNSLRIILVIIYVIELLILIFLIISFCAKMNKIIALSINIANGLIYAILFGIWRFASLSISANQTVKQINDIGGAVTANLDSFLGLLGDITIEELGETIKLFIKSCSVFYSVSYLLMFIFAIILLIFSIVCIFVGNPKVNEFAMDEFSDDFDRFNTIPPAEIEPITGPTPLEPPVIPQVAPPVVEPMGIVRCIKGVAYGQGMQIPSDRKVVVGKSGQRANFIVNDTHVSNVHCSIRYNPGAAMYTIIDHSTNGTYVNGNRLQKDFPMQFAAGTVISLANDDNQIKLG